MVDSKITSYPSLKRISKTHRKKYEWRFEEKLVRVDDVAFNAAAK